MSISATYRFVMAINRPVVKTWGRLDVKGAELLPAEGPLLIAGNHDSYWDPLVVGVAGMPTRQICALAKSTLWKPGLGSILDGMGQIPIQRGKGDAGAMDRAVEELRNGRCIGVFPEGTRTLGRELRARAGFGRLAQAVPEAEVLCVSTVGVVDIPRIGRRPKIEVEFFRPRGGQMQPGEDPAAFGQRLLDEIRERAPRVKAGR